MPGKFIKGALVELVPTLLAPRPNVIVFQFNPETLRHSWTLPQSARATAASEWAPGDPQAVQGPPGESFSLSLSMDANEQIAEGNPVALRSGISSRLAALERLMFPAGSQGEGLLRPAALSQGRSGVPASRVPTVLFVWGPGRIVPVRVTSLSVTEKLYDARLNPTHADAQLELRVLTPDELNTMTGPAKDVAMAAYEYTQGLRQVLAQANLGNAAESIIGMLPL